MATEVAQAVVTIIPSMKGSQQTIAKELGASVDNAAKKSGAKVLFGYCPADADSLVAAARNKSWLDSYERMLKQNYRFDGFLGEVETYIYARVYIYDSSFHLNDVGRTYHTYNLYKDLCAYLGGITPRGFRSVGTDFKGCIFETNSLGTPLTKVDYINW